MLVKLFLTAFVYFRQVDLEQAAELRSDLVSSVGTAGHRDRSILHAAPISQLARGILSSGPDRAINRSLMSMLLTSAEAAALLPPQDEEVRSVLFEALAKMVPYDASQTALGLRSGTGHFTVVF